MLFTYEQRSINQGIEESAVLHTTAGRRHETQTARRLARC